MIISSSNVDLASSRTYSKSIHTKTTAYQWTMDGRRMQSDTYTRDSGYQETVTSGDYSELAKTLGSSNHKEIPYVEPAKELQSTTKKNADYAILKATFQDLVEMIRNARFKKGLERSSIYNFVFGDNYVRLGTDEKPGTLSLTSNSSPSVWNRIQTTSYFMEETQNTTFVGKGNVVTSDGRNLDFNITVEMTSRFTESVELGTISQYKRILTDPLVINLDMLPTQISDKHFLFDLNCDGNLTEISQLSSSSGFLALDKNGDGIINDGSELFGTKSGNGFADLAEYDLDGNGWIDELDDIYSHLRVWVKDDEGKDKLLTLKDANVGAINLGNAKTDFEVKEITGETMAMIRSSGIYLTEDGDVKTVQQVDL